MNARVDMKKNSEQRVGMLLLHGLCGTPAEVRYVANGLTRQGIEVVCPRLTGYVGSPEEISASSWTDWVRSAEDALVELHQSCDTVIVGGLSTGAVLALMLAAKHPDKVDAVTLYSPTLWLSGRQVPWYLPIFRMLDSKRFASLFTFPVPSHVGIKDQRIRDFIRNSMAAAGSGSGPQATPGAAVLERRRLCKAVMQRLGLIRQPVLILHARDDDYAGLDNAAYLQRELAGPVDLMVLDDSYHMITVDRQRHIVLDRTSEFVARIAGIAKSGAKTAVRSFRPAVVA